MLPLLGLQLPFLSPCSLSCSTCEFLVTLPPPRSPGLEPCIFSLRHSLFSECIKKTYSFPSLCSCYFSPKISPGRKEPPVHSKCSDFVDYFSLAWKAQLPAARVSLCKLPCWFLSGICVCISCDKARYV